MTKNDNAWDQEEFYSEYINDCPKDIQANRLTFGKRVQIQVIGLLNLSFLVKHAATVT